jgi:hypothetical protein
MGVLLAKPLTIADLDKLKTDLDARLDNLQTDLHATLQPLMDALLLVVPDGDTESQRIAVAIRDNTDSHGLIGHGAILCMREKNEGSRTTSG